MREVLENQTSQAFQDALKDDKVREALVYAATQGLNTQYHLNMITGGKCTGLAASLAAGSYLQTLNTSPPVPPQLTAAARPLPRLTRRSYRQDGRELRGPASQAPGSGRTRVYCAPAADRRPGLRSWGPVFSRIEPWIETDPLRWRFRMRAMAFLGAALCLVGAAGLSGKSRDVGWAKARNAVARSGRDCRAPLPTIGTDASGTVGGGQRRTRGAPSVKSRASAFCLPYKTIHSLTP